MKLIIKSSSRYPASAVNWLVKFAANYVRTVAEREHWTHELDSYPLQVTVKNTAHAYSGVSLGVRRFADDPKNIYAGSHALRCFIVRIGPASKFPVNSTYSRYKDMPEATLNDWQEGVVGLTAHELTHTHYNYASGDRRSAEENCELVEIDCVEQFRKMGRALFDAAMQSEAQLGAEREQRAAAKRAPEAILATDTANAEAAVKRWTRKAKLAATKLKHYQRTLKRLRAKALAQVKGQP